MHNIHTHRFFELGADIHDICWKALLRVSVKRGSRQDFWTWVASCCLAGYRSVRSVRSLRSVRSWKKNGQEGVGGFGRLEGYRPASCRPTLSSFPHQLVELDHPASKGTPAKFSVVFVYGHLLEHAGEEAYSQWLHLYSTITEQISPNRSAWSTTSTSKVTSNKLPASYKHLQAARFQGNELTMITFVTSLYSTKTLRSFLFLNWLHDYSILAAWEVETKNTMAHIVFTHCTLYSTKSFPHRALTKCVLFSCEHLHVACARGSFYRHWQHLWDLY